MTEEFPFDGNTLVFKVMGKMFALTDVETFEGINLKVDPEVGAGLLDTYDFVQPGFHMNKKHWITVVIQPNVPENLVRLWIDQSYDLVVKGLAKSQKLSLDGL